MRIIAFIDRPEVIEEIPFHLGALAWFLSQPAGGRGRLC